MSDIQLSAEFSYELEVRIDEGSWTGVNLQFDANPKNLDQVVEVERRLVDEGYSTRIIRVVTTRTVLEL